MPAWQDAVVTWLLGILPPYTLPILIGLKEFWDECDDGTRLVLAFFGAVLVFCAVTRSEPAVRGQSRAADKDAEDKRPKNTPLWRRILWRFRPPADLMVIRDTTPFAPPLKIDRTRKLHCLWVAPTGGGKSVALAGARIDGARPTFIVAPDVSDPVRAKVIAIGGLVVTACEPGPRIDFLIGTAPQVALRLTKVFRSGGLGAWMRAARLATTQVVRDIDAAGEPRSLQSIGLGLKEATRHDRELKTTCSLWVDRFLDLAEQFDGTLDAGGYDLADLLQQGMTVCYDIEGFDNSGLGEDVVALGLAEAKRCASIVRGGFRLIFEEAGQIGERIELAEPFFRAARRHNIPVDVVSQAETDLKHKGSDAITGNITTRLYFAQELKSLRVVAADRLGIDESKLDPANMPDFSAWVAHGKIRRLIRFPKPPKPRTRPLTRPTYETHPTPSPTQTPYVRRMAYTEVEREPLALPPMPLRLKTLLDKIDRTSGDCWLWTGLLDRDGYGLQRWDYPDGRPKNNRPAHQVVWEVVNGRWFPTGDDGKPMEYDHRRTCPRHCVNPSHGEPKTKAANIAAMHRTRGRKVAVED